MLTKETAAATAASTTTATRTRTLNITRTTTIITRISRARTTGTITPPSAAARQ